MQFQRHAFFEGHLLRLVNQRRLLKRNPATPAAASVLSSSASFGRVQASAHPQVPTCMPLSTKLDTACYCDILKASARIRLSNSVDH
jgi:hypothetical protein